MTHIILISLLFILHIAQISLASFTYLVPLCENNNNISVQVTFEKPFYEVHLRYNLPASTEIKVKLDSGGTILIGNDYDKKSNSRLNDHDFINNIFSILIVDNIDNFSFRVLGKPAPEHPPYISSLKINGEEKCEKLILGKTLSAKIVEPYWSAAPDKYCGRRRIYKKHTELIVSGSNTNAGKWPWHAAIYRQERNLLKYKCGGTLLSTLLVLTGITKGFIEIIPAAHCITKNGANVNPETTSVVLGKFSLYDKEVTTQDKQVFKVIVHNDFNHKTLNNDIGLLKLDTEASFNNYVQPACLWFDEIYDQLDSYEVKGAIVGWGIDQFETLSNELLTTIMPQVSESVCIRYDPVFYSNILNGNKFCAGFGNGTAACNGDSGGGFVVFVPDVRIPSYSYAPEKRPGAWYVKGIISATIAGEDSNFCNPKAYTVLTDVAKYRSWILKYLK